MECWVCTKSSFLFLLQAMESRFRICVHVLLTRQTPDFTTVSFQTTDSSGCLVQGLVSDPVTQKLCWGSAIVAQSWGHVPIGREFQDCLVSNWDGLAWFGENNKAAKGERLCPAKLPTILRMKEQDMHLLVQKWIWLSITTSEQSECKNKTYNSFPWSSSKPKQNETFKTNRKPELKLVENIANTKNLFCCSVVQNHNFAASVICTKILGCFLFATWIGLK